jgi:hypothetical protein
MKKPVSNWIIVGTSNEKPFRPSDWAGRICELAGFMQPNRMVKYSEDLRPIKYNGSSAVFVHADLKTLRSEIWDQVMSFAQLHQLKVVEHADPVSVIYSKLEPTTQQLEALGKIEMAQLAA